MGHLVDPGSEQRTVEQTDLEGCMVVVALLTAQHETAAELMLLA